MTAIFTVLTIDPDVPVTVIVKVPGVVELLVIRVSVLVLVVLAGLNEVVTVLGRPDAVRFTVPVNPNVGVTVIVAVVLLPCVTVKVLGVDVSVNPGTPAVSANFRGVIPEVEAVIVKVPVLLGSV